MIRRPPRDERWPTQTPRRAPPLLTFHAPLHTKKASFFPFGNTDTGPGSPYSWRKLNDDNAKRDTDPNCTYICSGIKSSDHFLLLKCSYAGKNKIKQNKTFQARIHYIRLNESNTTLQPKWIWLPITTRTGNCNLWVTVTKFCQILPIPLDSFDLTHDVGHSCFYGHVNWESKGCCPLQRDPCTVIGEVRSAGTDCTGLDKNPSFVLWS